MSANYKTHRMTFRHGRKKRICFFITCFQRHSLRYNFGPGGSSVIRWLPPHNCKIVKTSRNVGDIVPTMWWFGIYGVAWNWEVPWSVNETKPEQRNPSFNEAFQMPAAQGCILRWPLPHRIPPQPSFIFPLGPQHAARRALQHCNSWWLSQLACVADISRLLMSVSSPIP